MLLQMDNNKKDNNYERNSKSTKGAFLTGFYKRKRLSQKGFSLYFLCISLKYSILTLLTNTL